MTTTNNDSDPCPVGFDLDEMEWGQEWDQEWDQEELLNPGWNQVDDFFVLLRASRKQEFYFPISKGSEAIVPLLRAFHGVLGSWIAKAKNKTADPHSLTPIKLLLIINRSHYPQRKGKGFKRAVAIGFPDPSFFYVQFEPQSLDRVPLHELIPLPGMDSPVLAQNLALLRNSLHPVESDGYILLFYGFELVQGDTPMAEIALGFWCFLPESDSDSDTRAIVLDQ